MKPKVLIVDDVPSVTAMLSDAIKMEPCDVLTARSAEEALAILKRRAVDVILTDEKMPGMSGSELVTIVRKQYPDIVRMMLTGHATLESALRAINEGEIYRYFLKPCSIIDLRVAIRQALEQRRLIRENRRLAEIVERQAASLGTLEKACPGITTVKRDAGGAVVIDE